MGITFRPIEKKDNLVLAELIRTVFREFKIDRPGTVYTDPTTDNLFSLFQKPGSAYWVAEENETVLGGCGIYPTEGLPEGCAELVKIYLVKGCRGKGIGKELMNLSTSWAKQFGYGQLYLESLPELNNAVGMYERAGFTTITKPLGNTGHFGCTLWMVKDL